MDARELNRLAALKALRVLDTPPSERFDRIVKLAADLFDVPIALISLIDEERQWFKARVGLEACSTDRRLAFCAHAIELAPNAVMVVEDATLDPRFARNPLVTEGPHIRFYAGALLTTQGGHNLGTLCIIDTVPRERPGERELDRLRNLARMVVDELELETERLASAEQHRLLEMAETMSGVGHWRLDLATSKPAWSKMVYQIHGVSPETFNPELDSAIDFYHPDDRQLVLQKLDEATQGKGGFNFQLRLIRADGSLRHVVSKGVCELDATGKPIAIIGLFQDITEHVAAREAAEESERRYRTLADHSTDLIVRFGRGGIITYASPASRILGITPEQAIGRSTIDFVHPDQREFAAGIVADLFNGEEPDRSVRREFRFAMPDGAELWLEGNPTILRDESGDPVEVITTYRDVTARKALEKRLELSAQAAEAAAQSKADFLANMSHELRTPLTAMIGFTELVQLHAGASGEARHYANRAMTAGLALMGTINDILDFSALEAGQVDLRKAPTDVAAQLAEVVDLLLPGAHAKNLQLVLDLPAPLSAALPDRLLIDPHRLQQIMMNLIGNAVKFTDAGQVIVSASYDPGSRALRISVSDTGPGISPEGQAKLFQRFSQVDGSSTRRHGGSGLGLAICRGLIDAHGGRIGCESPTGGGARFWFDLPAEAATAYAGSDANAQVARVMLDGVRILVADESAAVREILDQLLLSAGAEVTLVADGEAAIAAAASRPFDVVLVDLLMPDRDGVRVARAIRTRDALNADTPIIAMSAHFGSSPPKDLFDHAIDKPIASATLIRVLVEALNLRGDHAHAA